MALVTTQGYQLGIQPVQAIQEAQAGIDAQKMRELQRQGAQQGIQSQQMGLEQQRLGLQSQQRQQVTEQDQAAAEAMVSGAFQLKSITDPQGKLNYLAQRRAEFEAAGMPTQGIDQALNLARQGDWEGLAARTDELIALGQQMRQMSGRSRFQFGAQEMFKDEAGNMFFGTQRKDPRTGKVTSAVTAVSGEDIQPEGKLEQVGTYGLTAEEKANQVATETSKKKTAELNAQERQNYIASGVKAKNMVRNTERLLELNDLIRTGKTARARVAMGNLFGTTDPNLGEFNSRAGQLVLGQIRLLGANPTEGERRFLEEITPSIEQGQAVNEAILRDLLEVQKRQVARGRWFANNPGKTIEDYLLMSDEEEFVPREAPPVEQQKFPNAPEIGAVQGGYTYQGGDPANPNSWVQQ